MINWESIRSGSKKIWFTDIEGLGRYSMRKVGKEYHAFHNGDEIETPHADAEALRLLVEKRIRDDVEKLKATVVAEPERRRSFAQAAMDGVQQMASQHGAKVVGLNERQGFVIVFPNDDRMHFDVMEF